MVDSYKLSSKDLMKPSLVGVKAKYANAMQHADRLEGIYLRWRKSMSDNPPVEFPKIQSPNILKFSVKAPPPDPQLSLILGDFVHNLRVSLDHLASQLAARDGHNIKKRSSLAFPIFTDKSEYKKNEDRKIKKFIKDISVFEAIDEIQPYHLDDPRTDPLWLLSELDNIDKHRTLVVIAPRIDKKGVPMFTLGPAKDGKPPVATGPYTMGFQVELQPNNPVFTKDSATHSITFWIDTTIVLTNTGLLCDNWPIQKLIQILSTRVQEILNKFEKRFFSK